MYRKRMQRPMTKCGVLQGDSEPFIFLEMIKVTMINRAIPDPVIRWEGYAMR
jgi:hypothetical protein